MKEKEKLTNSKNGGGIYNKTNAFTLIELLAIIVILAIIAVITVPIILNVIENAKKGSAVDSAYGYKDAIEKYYVSQMLEDPDLKLNGNYVISEAGLLIDENGEDHQVATSGTVPSSGYITIENNEITGGCLTIDDYKVELSANDATATKGKCEFLAPGTEILFNPGSNAVGVTDSVGKCSNYSSSNINSGCMKWYVLNDHGSKVDLILDHNTTSSVNWVTEEDWYDTELSKSLGVTYIDNVNVYKSSHHGRGPLTLLNKLKIDTKEWSDKLIRNDSYNVNFRNSDGEQINYTIDYSGYKAKLISGEAIAGIVGINNWNFGTAVNLTGYVWLYSSTYWTSSPSNGSGSAHYVSPSPAGPPYPALFVWGTEAVCGVRPVITVSKTLLEN